MRHPPNPKPREPKPRQSEEYSLTFLGSIYLDAPTIIQTRTITMHIDLPPTDGMHGSNTPIFQWLISALPEDRHNTRWARRQIADIFWEMLLIQNSRGRLNQQSMRYIRSSIYEIFGDCLPGSMYMHVDCLSPIQIRNLLRTSLGYDTMGRKDNKHKHLPPP